MNISGVISALHDLFEKHGDIPVHPEGEGNSPVRSVQYADGHAVISDSFSIMDSIFNAFDFSGPDLSSSGMTVSTGEKGSINQVIAELRELRGMHGDVPVIPKGSGDVPAHAVYFFEGSIYLSEDAWDAVVAADAARTIAIYRNAQAGFVTYNVSELRPDDDTELSRPRPTEEEIARQQEIISSLPSGPAESWATVERQAIEDRYNVGFGVADDVPTASYADTGAGVDSSPGDTSPGSDSPASEGDTGPDR